MIKGFHYSINQIDTGSVLISNQNTAARWKFVLPIYQQVAADVGLVIPNEFAYCYPEPIPGMGFEFCYETETDYAVRGNCQFSPLMAICARLKAKDDIIEYAHRYLDLKAGERQELIGVWKVV